MAGATSTRRAVPRRLRLGGRGLERRPPRRFVDGHPLAVYYGCARSTHRVKGARVQLCALTMDDRAQC